MLSITGGQLGVNGQSVVQQHIISYLNAGVREYLAVGARLDVQTLHMQEKNSEGMFLCSHTLVSEREEKFGMGLDEGTFRLDKVQELAAGQEFLRIHDN